MTDFSTFVSVTGHAIAVHFAISLFVVSAAAYITASVSDKYVVQYQAILIARWSLWVASATMLMAIGFGLFAYMAESHDDMSHLLLNEHRNVALGIGLVVIILTLWLAVLRHDDKEEGKDFIFLHLIATVAILYVTWSGSVLVYQYGVGVAHLPDAQNHNHRTYQKSDTLFDQKKAEREKVE